MGSGETKTETSVEDLLAQITAREGTVRVLLRQDLIHRHEELTAELERVVTEDAEEHRMEPLSPALADAVFELEQEMDAAAVEFRFRSIGAGSWLDLLAKHPPTKEQRLGRWEFNPRSLPPAAIAASCIAPKMTIEHAEQFQASIHSAEWTKLWNCCQSVNAGGSANPKSPIAGRIRLANAELGLSPPSSESPDPDSLDG